MHLRRLEHDFYVADQLQPADLRALADRGIRSILNNRPEGEGADQPAGTLIEGQARALGMAYDAVPIAGRSVGAKERRRFRRVVAALPRPICAYCRTGVRSMLGWALTELEAKGTNAVLNAVAGAGFETEWLRSAITKQTHPACHKET